MSSKQVLKNAFATIMKALAGGAPKVVVLIRGPDRDYAVTAEDRVRVGTFFGLLKSALANQRQVDPNSFDCGFLNFR